MGYLFYEKKFDCKGGEDGGVYALTYGLDFCLAKKWCKGIQGSSRTLIEYTTCAYLPIKLYGPGSIPTYAKGKHFK